MALRTDCTLFRGQACTQVASPVISFQRVKLHFPAALMFHASPLTQSPGTLPGAVDAARARRGVARIDSNLFLASCSHILADALHACRAFCVIQDPVLISRGSDKDAAEVAPVDDARPSPRDFPPPRIDGWGWMATHVVCDLQTTEACLVRFADVCLCWLDAGVVDQRGDVVGWYGYKRRGKNDWAWVDEMRKAANFANTHVLREMNQRLADLNKQQERTSPWSCFVEAASSLGTEPFRKTLPDFHGIGGEHVARTTTLWSHTLCT